MVIRKVANPAPAALVLVNPKRGAKKMATRRRRRSAAVHHRANPINKRRKSLTLHRRIHTKQRHTQRRSNPFGGAFGEAVPLVGAGFVIGFASPIVNGLVGRFLPLGQFGGPVTTVATGYGLGWAATRLGFSKYKRPLEVMAITLGLTQLVTPYLSGLLRPTATAAPTKTTGMNGARGMGDIVTLPPGNYDPYYGSTPSLATPRPNKAAVMKAAMNGLGAVTTMRPFGVQRY